MSVLVLIIKYWTKPGNHNIANLTEAFSDPYFLTRVYDEVVPENVDPQSYLILNALIYSASNFSSLPVILIMDNSVTNVSPTTMASFVQNSLLTGSGLVYLTKWEDQCGSYVYVDPSLSKIAWTKNPQGAQCVLYTPVSRDSLIPILQASETTAAITLTSLINQSKISAVTFVPNIVDFDIRLATNNSQLLYLNECVSETNQTDNSASAIVYFIIAIGVLILFAWALLSLGPKD
jgi:hypothetical protein